MRQVWRLMGILAFVLGAGAATGGCTPAGLDANQEIAGKKTVIKGTCEVGWQITSDAKTLQDFFLSVGGYCHVVDD